MIRFLIIKTSSLGDIVHIFPVLDYLKACFPECLIDIIVEKSFAGLLEAHPYINQVFTIDSKKWRKNLCCKSTWKEITDCVRQLRKNSYFKVFDLQGNCKSALITALSRGEKKVGFGSSCVAEWPNLFVTNEKHTPPLDQNIRLDYLFLVSNSLKKDFSGREHKELLRLLPQQRAWFEKVFQHCCSMQGLKVMVCPGSQWPNKQLSFETWKEYLGEFLLREPKTVFLFAWGTDEEKALVTRLHREFEAASCVLDRMPLPVLQQLMSWVDLVIAVDSLPLHLAGTTQTSTFSVFGPSSAFKYKPLGEQHIAFQATCPYGKKFNKRCADLRTCSTGACLKDLKGKKLYDFYREKKSYGK